MSKGKRNSVYFRVVHENGYVAEFEVCTLGMSIDKIIETLEFIVSIQ